MKINEIAKTAGDFLGQMFLARIPESQWIPQMRGPYDPYNGIIRDVANMVSPKPQKLASSNGQVKGAIAPSPTPTPSPTMPPEPPRIDFTGYTQRSGQPLVEPPRKLQDLFFKYFPDEATPSAAVAYGENATYNPEAMNDKNLNGSTDYGLMQVNSKTFNGLKTRPYWKDRMKEIGIEEDTQPEDVLYDPEMNLKIAKLIHDDETMAGAEPFQRWFGWMDKDDEGKILGKGINLREMMKKKKKK